MKTLYSKDEYSRDAMSAEQFLKEHFNVQSLHFDVIYPAWTPFIQMSWRDEKVEIFKVEETYYVIEYSCGVYESVSTTKDFFEILNIRNYYFAKNSSGLYGSVEGSPENHEVDLKFLISIGVSVRPNSKEGKFDCRIPPEAMEILNPLFGTRFTWSLESVDF